MVGHRRTAPPVVEVPFWLGSIDGKGQFGVELLPLEPSVHRSDGQLLMADMSP